MLNRSLITVFAREPFLDWLRGLPEPIAAEATLELINAESTAYLVPRYDDEDERDEIFEDIYDMLFEHQLSSWCAEDEHWPADRTLPMFESWFEVQWHPFVEDVLDEPLEEEDAEVEDVADDD